MATVSQLIKTIAGVTGLPEKTVNVYARALLDSGRLPLTKGRAFAHVDPRHCADLLCAVAARPTVKRAEEFAVVMDGVTADFSTREIALVDPSQKGSMTAGEPVEGDARWHLEGFNLPLLQSLPIGHSFPAALAAFVETLMGDDFAKCATARWPGKVVNYGLEFTITEPGPWANIEVDIWVEGECRYQESLLYAPPGADPHHKEDLHTQQRFSWRTVLAIADLLSERVTA